MEVSPSQISGIPPNPISAIPPWEGTPTEWDAWIRSRRPELGEQRRRLSLDQPAHWLRESEATESGKPASIFTIFLTNRECPWHCLMCDLWKHTTETRGEAQSIPAQISSALRAAVFAEADHLKLYNAGSFFDAGAVPVRDHPEIARLCRGFKRVIVESHPRLVRGRVRQFQSLLAGSELEVAMGLESAHPEVLRRLNKGITPEDFRRAAGYLRESGVRVRAFVLVQPPFLTDPSEALEWACRTLDFAWSVGVQVVSLIPTRGGNGAMEELARLGQFRPPDWDTVESAFRHGIQSKRGLVFMDLWDLEKTLPGDAHAVRRDLLTAMNRYQRSTFPESYSFPAGAKRHLESHEV